MDDFGKSAQRGLNVALPAKVTKIKIIGKCGVGDICPIEKGKTNRQEVAQQFGAPDDIVQANGYEIFHYRRFDSKLGWLLFLSRLNIGSDHLWVFFNSQGIVDDVVFGNRTRNVEFQIWPFGE